MKHMLFFRRMLTLLAVLTLFIGGCWSDEQVTLVHCAANGKTDCVERMLSDGASVNGHGKEGRARSTLRSGIATMKLLRCFSNMGFHCLGYTWDTTTWSSPSKSEMSRRFAI